MGRRRGKTKSVFWFHLSQESFLGGWGGVEGWEECCATMKQGNERLILILKEESNATYKSPFSLFLAQKWKLKALAYHIQIMLT